ncbi:fimbrial protein [Burkholderia aenigmatica]|uniref:fimbrial protein n=1 Tax=Burkholderia aenigmatica TaxID=2015348 RepID=UPI002652880F|nr:fimbrial protein [Burkholderia aenigmatica]MDN7880914.1 fimbrial protein [Burkholderia aenigmatica]
MKIGLSAAYRACLIVGALLPATAWAAPSCYYTYSEVSGSQKYYEPMVATIPSMSPPSFSPSVAVGTVLISQEIASVGRQIYVWCDTPGGGIKNTLWTREGAQGAYSTWPTNVAGIGVRIQFTGSGGGIGQWWPHSADTSAMTNIFNGNRKLLIQFVKTGPISAGGTLSGELGAGWAMDKSFKFISFQIAGGGITITPRVPTCNVRDKAPTVPLGDIAANLVMPRVGDTSEAKPFKIVLDCEGGETGTITKTYMTLTDVHDNANRSDTLTLAPESTAKGLGVQVLHNSQPVSFGPDSSMTGNPNQFATGNTPNGVLEIPLSARYVRTGMLLGGSVKARASFTMSYQ